MKRIALPSSVGGRLISSTFLPVVFRDFISYSQRSNGRQTTSFPTPKNSLRGKTETVVVRWARFNTAWFYRLSKEPTGPKYTALAPLRPGARLSQPRPRLLVQVQGTGIKRWYRAGVGLGWFGQNCGTPQPNHPLTETMLLW